jgi:hypothetical protein
MNLPHEWHESQHGGYIDLNVPPNAIEGYLIQGAAWMCTFLFDQQGKFTKVNILQ